MAAAADTAEASFAVDGAPTPFAAWVETAAFEDFILHEADKFIALNILTRANVMKAVYRLITLFIELICSKQQKFEATKNPAYVPLIAFFKEATSHWSACMRTINIKAGELPVDALPTDKHDAFNMGWMRGAFLKHLYPVLLVSTWGPGEQDAAPSEVATFPDQLATQLGYPLPSVTALTPKDILPQSAIENYKPSLFDRTSSVRMWNLINAKNPALHLTEELIGFAPHPAIVMSVMANDKIMSLNTHAPNLHAVFMGPVLARSWMTEPMPVVHATPLSSTQIESPSYELDIIRGERDIKYDVSQIEDPQALEYYSQWDPVSSPAIVRSSRIYVSKEKAEAFCDLSKKRHSFLPMLTMDYARMVCQYKNQPSIAAYTSPFAVYARWALADSDAGSDKTMSVAHGYTLDPFLKTCSWAAVPARQPESLINAAVAATGSAKPLASSTPAQQDDDAMEVDTSAINGGNGGGGDDDDDEPVPAKKSADKKRKREKMDSHVPEKAASSSSAKEAKSDGPSAKRVKVAESQDDKKKDTKKSSTAVLSHSPAPATAPTPKKASSAPAPVPPPKAPAPAPSPDANAKEEKKPVNPSLMNAYRTLISCGKGYRGFVTNDPAQAALVVGPLLGLKHPQGRFKQLMASVEEVQKLISALELLTKPQDGLFYRIARSATYRQAFLETSFVSEPASRTLSGHLQWIQGFIADRIGQRLAVMDLCRNDGFLVPTEAAAPYIDGFKLAYAEVEKIARDVLKQDREFVRGCFNIRTCNPENPADWLFVFANVSRTLDFVTSRAMVGFVFFTREEVKSGAHLASADLFNNEDVQGKLRALYERFAAVLTRVVGIHLVPEIHVELPNL